MDKQPPPDQGSFTLKRVVILFVVAIMVGGGFFAVVYFFNEWYVAANAVSEKKILVTLDSKDANSSPSTLTPDQTDASSDLTFFKYLTDQETSYPAVPPEPSISPKASKSSLAPVKSLPPAPPLRIPAAAIRPETKPVQQAAGGEYIVQVGSFQSRSSAESLQKELQGKGISSYIVLVRAENGSSWYRVRVGNALPRSDADALAAKLQSLAKVRPMVIPGK